MSWFSSFANFMRSTDIPCFRFPCSCQSLQRSLNLLHGCFAWCSYIAPPPGQLLVTDIRILEFWRRPQKLVKLYLATRKHVKIVDRKLFFLQSLKSEFFSWTIITRQVIYLVRSCPPVDHTDQYETILSSLGWNFSINLEASPRLWPSTHFHSWLRLLDFFGLGS